MRAGRDSWPTRVPAVRRVPAVLLVAVMVVGLGGTTRATGAEQPRGVGDVQDDLAETGDAIAETEQELDAARQQVAGAAEQVRESDRQLREYEEELASLRGRLATAQEEARIASERSEAARGDLERVDRRLADTEQALDTKQEELHDRAVSAFMYGEATVADAALGARSVHDFVNTTYYMRTVLLADVDVVDTVDSLRAELVEQRTESDLLREVVQQEQRAADAAQLELEDLTAAQTQLTELAEQERQRRVELLAQLQIHEAATEAQLIDLETESASLTRELQELHRQRDLERRREAERRQQQERERQRQQQGGAGSGSGGDAGSGGGAGSTSPPPSTPPPSDGGWVWPTAGRLTSPFGYRTHPIYGGRRLHAGVDVGAGYGTPIVAAQSGYVLSAYCTGGGYGCRVVIDHGGGVATMYAHQSSFAVAEGQDVSAGQTIGYVGSTGASTGPHLHFEVRVDGAPTDPMARY